MENFTPLELVVEAAEQILAGDYTGAVLECSNKKIYKRVQVDYSDENSKWLIEDMHRMLAAH